MQLNHTLTEVRALETAHYGEVRWPQPWWPPGPSSSYCVGWQTIKLGLRTGTESGAYLDTHPHLISIAAFRAHYQFPEVPPEQIQPGDLVLSNWTGTTIDIGGRSELEAEHMEWAYSRDRAGNSVMIIGANTGPEDGVPEPNGVWKKTRPLDSHILFGIRLPYAPDKPSRGRKHEVQVVAGFVNAAVPPPLPRTTSVQDGIEGPNYWHLVQTWGRIHGYYGSYYIIDGIPGPQSRIVEAAAYKAATAKK
ncbi:MAG: hypothetical protein HIU88_10280 [Acidobacteria bacterium]|nr:hypothetical protein [Acidobacteriota bacterium]